MAYAQFLQIISQLSCKNLARCTVKNQIISIENRTLMGKGKKWRLSAKVFNGDDSLPPSVLDCVSSTGILRWQEGERGASLRVDPFSNDVLLVQEVEAPKHYTTFRYLLNDFSSLAEEWNETFKDLAARDPVNRDR